MTPRFILIAVAAGTIVAACSKGEPPPPARALPAPAPAKPAAAGGPGGEIDAALKERLARQEAAARLFEKNVLQPPPPKVPEPPSAAKATPAPKPPSPATALPTVTEPKVEPPREAARPVASPPAAAAAPRTEQAAARSAPPAPSQAVPQLVTRIDPEFPREAAQAGVDQGSVRARMTLDAAGNVSRVEIVEASPRRVFDRAVSRALSQWRYNEGAAGRTVDMEVVFRR